ncbi:MAG: mechanosensitive ion channel family protein [Candidatus Obscuribacterales bacterium]|nr:mechanosensitive ion channel family protein [Candidatus Obscuribacterales bacterium]
MKILGLRLKRFIAIIFAALLVLGPGFSAAIAQNQKEEPAALVVNGKRLMTFYASLDGLTPKERVERAAEVLRELSKDQSFNIDQIKTFDGISGTEIIAGNKRIATVTSEDAAIENGNTALVANDCLLKIRFALAKRAEQLDASAFMLGIVYCIVGFILFVLLIALVCKCSIYACEHLVHISEDRLKGIRIQQAELISAQSMLDMLTRLVKSIQLFIVISLAAAYVLVSLSFFPSTKPLAFALFESAKLPLVSLGESAVEYLPKLFIVAIISLITYLCICAARFFFNALRDGSISFADFDPDWAEPSYRLTRVAFILFAFVCALPYLPGWGSPAFNQLGLLIGILISFGSTSVVSNVMAGIVLTYTNAFRLGDRVKINDCLGDITEKTLFVTRLRTPKGELVSIPNSTILSNNVTNYTAESKRGKLILYKTVTIGYDVPWRKVHEALLEAAKATPKVLEEPAPFVLQSSLDDFYVSYQVNIYTDKASDMLEIYSRLNENIQDSFFKAGLEIMSPHYTSIRDGNSPAIPAEFLPEDFQAPAFKISSENS